MMNLLSLSIFERLQFVCVVVFLCSGNFETLVTDFGQKGLLIFAFLAHE